MIEAGIAIAFVTVFGGELGINTDGFWPTVGLTWIPIYLASCRWWRTHVWCFNPGCSTRKPVAKTGRKFRRRGACWLCKGKQLRRPGAVLVGVAK